VNAIHVCLHATHFRPRAAIAMAGHQTIPAPLAGEGQGGGKTANSQHHEATRSDEDASAFAASICAAFFSIISTK
jgi:hypothetical protein